MTLSITMIDWFIDKLYESEEDNPYIEAWWKWWPEVSKTLNILRITGGEPTIHGLSLIHI